MTLSLQTAADLLLHAGLLKETIIDGTWQLNPPAEPIIWFQKLAYDSRKAESDTLFFCKGLHFDVAYLHQAIAQGVQWYVAETPYDVSANALIVTDIRKALAVLSMAFYDYPQNQLTLIAFTGTKGKTTAAYFAKGILDETTQQKTALFSTMNTTLNGVDYFKSALTTPESLELYEMMAQAVANGMTHLIMEVSSQAYKTQRVYGLTFDVGIFLNISPDHISPIEHPTFDDYFYCKRQLLLNSETLILNRESDYFDLLQALADQQEVPVFTYGSQAANADYRYIPSADDSLSFTVKSLHDPLHVAGDYQIQLAGDFNKGNALAALLATACAGAERLAAQTGLAKVTIPGRMEQLALPNGATVYVDYAHNYLSLVSLLQFARSEHPNGRLLVVIGSTGSKAVSRRQDFGKALSEYADYAILTTDDPDIEDPAEITAQIQAAITSSIEVVTLLDRTKAIQYALSQATANDTVILAGKGADPYQKINGVDVPYAGDLNIAKEWVNLQS